MVEFTETAALVRQMREALIAVESSVDIGLQRRKAIADADQWLAQQAIDELAALRAQGPVTEPAGWKLVPVEPTPKMLACLVRKLFPEDWEAGKSLLARQRGENRVPFAAEYEIAAGQYERMLAASPSAPQPPREVERLSDCQLKKTITDWYGSIYLAVGYRQVSRAIESACAEAWGLKLKEQE